MPIRESGEDVGRGRRDHDLPEELELVEPQHGRDVAVVLRDVADADGGVDDDRPDRGDEDHEDRRGLAVAEGGKRDRQPGQRRDGAQHLEDRVETAHGPNRLADDGAEHDADQAGEPIADGDALQRGQHAPAEADVLRTGDEERIDDEVARLAPDLGRRRQRGARLVAQHLPDEQDQREGDQRRDHTRGQR